MRGIIDANTEVNVNIVVLVVAAIAAVVSLARPFLRMTGRDRIQFVLILGVAAIAVVALDQIPVVHNLPDAGP